MGDTLNIAEPDGQHRLGAFQRLDLALFIRRRKRVPVRWIEIQADSAAQLLDEEGIGGNLEAAGPTRLQGEELKQSMHGPLGKSGLVSHGAHAQWVAASGLLASVLLTSVTTASSLTVRGRPDRTSS